MAQEPTDAPPRRVRLWTLGVSIVLTSLALAVAVSNLWPPPPVTPEGSFLIAVDSEQSGGVLRLDVEAADPIDLVHDTTVELLITVESSVKASPAFLTLGGAGATRVISCNGTGVFIDPRVDAGSFDELPPSTSALLLEYFGRPSATGRLYSKNDDPVRSADAQTNAEAQSYRTAVATPNSESTFSFVANDQPAVEYSVWRAELTCIFEIEAFLGRSGNVLVLRVPDLIIGAGDQAGDGLIHASYRLQLANDIGLATVASTFTGSRRYVDPITERQLLEMTGEWWASDYRDKQAVSYAAGHAQFEPEGASIGRVHAQLAAGFLASLLLSLLVAAVGLLFTRDEADDHES